MVIGTPARCRRSRSFALARLPAPGLSSAAYTSLAMWRFRQRTMSRSVRPSAWRLAPGEVGHRAGFAVAHSQQHDPVERVVGLTIPAAGLDRSRSGGHED